MSSREGIDEGELERLQRQSFSYFLHETNPDNGLVIDKTAPDWPASIAATGFALAAYPVAVERGFMPRAAAVERTLTTLRFFWNSRQGLEPDATGYQGFYYHFLDMRTGRRAWQCELSTVDSAFLLAGALAAGMYFAADRPDENEIPYWQFLNRPYCTSGRRQTVLFSKGVLYRTAKRSAEEHNEENEAR